MRAFGPHSRVAAAAAGLAAFAAAYATTPLSARDGAGVSSPPPSTLPASPREREPIVVPARDPFAYVEGAPPQSVPVPLTRAALPQIPALLGPLPPNAGARGDASAPAFRVEAVVTGPHPLALVAEGAATRVVGRGDAAGGSIVDDVRADGVHLRSGVVIAPSPEGGPPSFIPLPTPPPFARQGER